MGVEVENMISNGGIELLGRRNGDDAGCGGEKFWIENVQGGDGHAVVD